MEVCCRQVAKLVIQGFQIFGTEFFWDRTIVMVFECRSLLPLHWSYLKGNRSLVLSLSIDTLHWFWLGTTEHASISVAVQILGGCLALSYAMSLVLVHCLQAPYFLVGERTVVPPQRIIWCQIVVSRGILLCGMAPLHVAFRLIAL